MILNKENAEMELKKAEVSNPGDWVKHSYYVALACETITAHTDDLSKDVKWYKQQGIKACAAMRKDAVPYWNNCYTEPCLIAIGGEMRGLSSGVLKEMDQNIYIPYANDFRAALNAAGACAAIFFEAFRQREAVTSKMQ